ncbi:MULTISPECIES: Hsp33 family molecular chaperone HslO [Thiomicrorhabdus]|uniref:Hsp33 family molecular chaperone HslO n=1 Tax=Thiomicrorhabdus heinhorstiae TaxID=2748010 RepID=A0ABS0BW24_9GAMM|nr:MULTISPECIES: Hsp33 family molecular chaperone HslO [Thiomicrorhabdus]MBF6057164.1 Hsp33 family molecular chaperone HslO [Thiomicrorhabdus heinhorstiae]
MATNSIQRFLFKEHNIRGQVIQLHDAWQQMTKDRHYPPIISQLLGELTAVSVVMANGMKHLGKITLQVQGSGPVNLLVVEVTHDLKIRGVAKTSETIDGQKTLDELLGDGQILVTMENMQTKHHFQSYVSRDGETIAECFELFFSQSEQLPSKIWLAADEQQLGGILIQKMPDSDENDADAWDRIVHLTDTLSDEELTTLDSETLLHRLFHEELVELFEEQTVVYECPQDRQRVDDMLRSLGEEEIRKLLEEQGEIVIHNEICNVHFRYDAKAVDELFTESHSVQ